MMEKYKKSTYRARHMDVQNFSLQEWIELKQVILEHIRTHLNVADTSTKAIVWSPHNVHTQRMMGGYGSTFMHR